MSPKELPQQRFFELALVLICVALCWLLYMTGAYRMVVLHLFYLPVILAAFFLGRYQAGVLALLCAVGAAVVVTVDVNMLVSFNSPVVMWLALTIWSAVLGLAAILAGTLSDERTAKIAELHDAYVGVVEVLSRYLNSTAPNTDDHVTQVSQLSHEVARRMGLPSNEADNIRVAALLQDINQIEITAKVIQKAVGNLQQASQQNAAEHTFHGSDLVCSLGAVLKGAWPLLLDHGHCLGDADLSQGILGPDPAPLGASIIRTASRFVTLLRSDSGVAKPSQAIEALRDDLEGEHNPAVVCALEWVVLGSDAAAQAEAEPSYV